LESHLLGILPSPRVYFTLVLRKIEHGTKTNKPQGERVKQTDEYAEDKQLEEHLHVKRLEKANTCWGFYAHTFSLHQLESSKPITKLPQSTKTF